MPIVDLPLDVSGSLRVGFVACAQHIANELADIIREITSILRRSDPADAGVEDNGIWHYPTVGASCLKVRNPPS